MTGKGGKEGRYFLGHFEGIFKTLALPCPKNKKAVTQEGHGPNCLGTLTYCVTTVTPRRFCAQALSLWPSTAGRSLP